MDLFPYLFRKAFLATLLCLIAAICPLSRALEPCDLIHYEDNFLDVPVRGHRVGPRDIFECRACPSLLSYRISGGELEPQLPESEFREMIVRDATVFRQHVFSRIKALWDGEPAQTLRNISETVPPEKLSDASLHEATLAAMKDGVDLIVRPFLMTDTRFAHPDFLIKVPARDPPDDLSGVLPMATDFGFLDTVAGPGAIFGKTPVDYYYLPILIKSGSLQLKNLAFNPDDLSVPPLLRRMANADYSILMIHTLAVLQEIQYGQKVPGPDQDLASADQRIFLPHGIFIVRDRHELDPQQPGYINFSYFSLDTQGLSELNKVYDPTFRAYWDSYRLAYRVREAGESPLHFSSACKTCPLRNIHVPQMESDEDVSLIYLLKSNTAAQFRNTEASVGRLDTYMNVAKLDISEAMNLFPRLEGVSDKNTIPELYRILRQARSLVNKVTIDNSPPPPPDLHIPSQIIEILSEMGIYSFSKLLDLEKSGEWDDIVEMITAAHVDQSAHGDLKKQATRLKSVITRALGDGRKFGDIWEYDQMRSDMHSTGEGPTLMAILVALKKYELGWQADLQTVEKSLSDVLTWAHAIKNYTYFDVLTLSATDRGRYSSQYAIYFDIEGDPELRPAEAPWMKTEYAWGLRIVDVQTGRMVREEVLTLSDFSLAGMEDVWRKYLEVVHAYDDARVYYFSDYESEVIHRFIRIFNKPSIAQNPRIFTKKGIEFFNTQADYRKFKKDYGAGLENPQDFNEQAVIVEYILKTFPSLPQGADGVTKTGRKDFEALTEYVASSLGVIHRMVDLRREIREAYTLPTYSYDLKTIAKHYHFQWRDVESNALQSIVWFRRYLELKDTDPEQSQAFLNRIIQYNVDDVRATELLHLFMRVRLADDYIQKMTNRRRRSNYLQSELEGIARRYNKRL